MIQLPENLDFLKDKNWVEDFLNQNSENIFGQKFEVKVLEIERSKSFAPEVYNMLYKIDLGGEDRSLRASSSTIRERETTFKIMDYLYKTGFSSGEFVVPQALKFFPELNLMFYFDLEGSTLKNLINKENDVLVDYVRRAGLALKKMHAVPVPNFPIGEYHWAIEKEKILKYAPDLRNIIENNLNQKINETKDNSFLCHGDYQLENVLIGKSFGIIDFGASTLACKELDIACFVVQLEVMLQRFSTVDKFDSLKTAFLDAYGEFNKNIYMTHDFLFRLQVMFALIIMFEKDLGVNKIEIKNTIDYWTKRIKEIYSK